MKPNLDNKTISVAIATYNGSKYLGQLMESLLQQTVIPDEIFIVDDCSVDDTLEIIKSYNDKYPFIRYIVNKVNLGAIESFKLAVSNCNGVYTALCDQDDIWKPNKLEISIKTLKEIDIENKPALIYTDLSIIDNQGGLSKISFWESLGMCPERESFKSSMYGNIATGCTMVFNKHMKREMLLMPETVLMHDHWLAMIAYGFGNIKAVNLSTVFYRSHAESVTEKKRINIFRKIEVYIKLIFREDDYLLKNIYQAKSFKNMYFSRLTIQKKLVLEQFILLRDRSLIVKKIAAFRKYTN
ncbi:glycosyltransferase family 2 protein [Pedobacter namyangjuensis]|uniref:glycosyltransferase family 2 protein n=1 Tax=Pedobacter namyangjuensis TaxID=600626 RepID=UPI000DE4D2BE|nr:glycosyltransferase family 2 protein [Pedobacter namyangjuensis]